MNAKGGAMNLESIRQDLLTQRERLQRRYDAINKDFRQGRSQDFAEQATENENNDVLMGLRGEAQDEINQIDSALLRIEEGRYGICSSCQASIAEQRLRALPFAGECVACADGVSNAATLHI